MKKNILFNVFVMLFAFMVFTGNVSATPSEYSNGDNYYADYYEKKCDYSNTLKTLTCTKEQKIYSTSKEQHPSGSYCIIALSDQNGPKDSVTISGKCPKDIDVQFVSGTTCALYGCDLLRKDSNVTTGVSGVSGISGVSGSNEYQNSDIAYNTCTISCGDVTGIPQNLPTFIRRLVNVLKVLVPVILVVMGIIDFLKAMTAGDEKIMSESPRKFVRRIIVSVLIFLVIVVVQFVIRLVSDASIKSGSNNPAGGMAECISCFISDGSSCGKSVCK